MLHQAEVLSSQGRQPPRWPALGRDWQLARRQAVPSREKRISFIAALFACLGNRKIVDEITRFSKKPSDLFPHSEIDRFLTEADSALNI